MRFPPALPLQMRVHICIFTSPQPIRLLPPWQIFESHCVKVLFATFNTVSFLAIKVHESVKGQCQEILRLWFFIRHLLAPINMPIKDLNDIPHIYIPKIFLELFVFIIDSPVNRIKMVVRKLAGVK
jgi:hypothetical protein